MRSTYLTKAVIAASRTMSSAKPPQGLSHVLLPNVGSSWTGAAISTGGQAGDYLSGSRDTVPLAEGASHPGPAMPGAHVDADEGTSTPLDRQAMDAPPGPKPRRFGLVSHAEMVYVAPAAKVAKPDPGVLARLSRPVTRVQAPSGLRPQAWIEGQPIPTTAQAQEELRSGAAVSPGSEAAPQPSPASLGSGSLSPMASGPLPGPGNSSANPAQPHPSEPRSSKPARSAVRGELPHANPSQQPHPPSEQAEPVSRAPAASPRQPLSSAASASLVQRRTGAESLCQPGVPSAPDSASDFTPDRLATAANQQVEPRTASANPRPTQQAPAPASPYQPRRERRISIGQIDVHVNNQPSAPRSAARPPAPGRQPSSLLQYPDVSRFLLRP